MNKFIITILLCFCLLKTFAQKQATKIIPINDTTISQFSDINELYFLYDRFNGDLQKLVKKLALSKNQNEANIIIGKIAKIKNPTSAVILTLDYFFKYQKPLPGSNVENVLHKLANGNSYYLLNENFLQNSIDKNLPIELFKKKIQDTIGWAYGYGAFYYLSPQDSIYLAKMKNKKVSTIDEQVEEIIENHLEYQGTTFTYNKTSIKQEILAIKNVVDAQWDDCIIKTMQLPNWDNIGIIIVQDKDTIERVYTIQYGKFKRLKLGKHISFPIQNESDILWYKGVKYGLHFVALTRQQCQENERQHKKNLEEMNKFLEDKK